MQQEEVVVRQVNTHNFKCLKAFLLSSDHNVDGCKMRFILTNPSEYSYAEVILVRSGRTNTSYFRICPIDWGKLGVLMERHHCWHHIVLNWEGNVDEGLVDLVISELRGHIHGFF